MCCPDAALAKPWLKQHPAVPRLLEKEVDKETAQGRAESMAKRSCKPHWPGKTVRFTLALYREKAAEEAHLSIGECYNKDSAHQIPLFFPRQDKKQPPKFARSRLKLDLRANCPSENE